MELLNVTEIAQYLKRSESSIRNLVARRQIPFRKLGGRLVFIKKDILEWVYVAKGLSIDDFKNNKL